MEHLGLLKQVAPKAEFAIGQQAASVYNAAWHLKGVTANRSESGSSYNPKGDASTGFHAVLTFRPLCHSISLFGFSGKKSLDGHRMSENHMIDREHALLYNMRTARDGAAPVKIVA